MKKLASIVAAAVLLFSTSSFAANGSEKKTSAKTNARVVAFLKKDFSISAEDVKWENQNGFYFTSFKKDNNKTEVAYNGDGELLAVSKKIELSQLPLAVTAAISKQFKGFEIGNNADEITCNGETSYYLTLADTKKIVYVKYTVNGDLSIEKSKKRSSFIN